MDNTGYKISTTLQSDAHYITCHAVEESDGKSIIVKLLKNPYPTSHALSRFRNEYEILNKARHPNIVNALRMEPYQNSIAIILEDVQGCLLREYTDHKPVDFSTFFSIAIPLVDAIKFLHQNHIIHKNINPSNIIIETLTSQPKLSGFTIADELSREAQQPNSRELSLADLSYISPEQTARMNRTIDNRTDIYSLGIVFYELLTGSTPFFAGDPMEIIHSHIAKQPKPANKVRKDIPGVLSNILSRLLSKSADDRYQSAAGLLDDLRQCSGEYETTSTISNFNLGATDIYDQIRIPDKLYGRTDELNQLLAYYNNAAKGGSEVALVSGYSGVGKSRLVSEVKKLVYQEKGYFISGKFDQFKRDVPLRSLLQAMSELIRLILAENDERMLEWKEKLVEALSPNGKIITDVIPEVELLIGPQPTVSELPPMEANNRFNIIFSRFVKTFTKPEHPLCIFLDDLQWIDSATRQWIETQLTLEELNSFMLIGAYRDNEVSASHPLMLMLDRLRQNGISIGEINLQPLNKETLNQMVADVLVTEPLLCNDLSDLVYQKTNGNPFFTRQCLLTLYDENAIYFDSETIQWKYVLEKARNVAISNNVLELMLDQIKQLSPAVQKMLKIASCVGNQFSINLVNQISEQELETTTEQISIAVQKGLVLPVYSWNKDEIEEYKFLHDRVQQATAILLTSSETKSIRLKTGRILLESASAYDTEDKIYDIADHLNYAGDLITTDEEIQKLVEVNLAASARAKNATAYEPALHYIKQSMDLVAAATWDQTADTTSKLLLQRAECEHLNGNNEVAETYYDQAINKTEGVLSKARVYQRKIHYYNNLRQFNDAYKTGRTAVKMLGVSLHSRFIPPLFGKDLVVNQFLMGRKKIRDILYMKEMADENLRMAILLMATFARSAYQIKPELCIAVCTKMVNICLKHGNTEGGFIGYLAFGPIFQGAILNRKQKGFDYGQLILALVEKYKSQFYKAETNFVVGYFAIPWRRPATEMEQYWQVAYEAGLEVGDFFHTSCASCGTIQSYYMRGVGFTDIMSASDRYIEFLKRIKNNEAILTIASVQQSIKNLRGETTSKISFSSADFNEEEYVKKLSEFHSRHFAHYYYINKMQTLYLWGEYQKAYEISLISDQYLKDSPGMMHTAEHFFYKALIICALFNESGNRQRRKWRRTLHKIRNKFRSYSKGCTSNFMHKYQLIEAEISRLDKKYELAENYYYSSIESATKYGYANILALANLRAGDFHFNLGRQRLAGFHLRDAKYSYRTMGATAYADQLIQLYPGLSEFGEAESNRQVEDAQPQTLTLNKMKPGNLDLSTILKSSEAISREIRLKDLLGSLLKIIIE
ncbi:MAG: serine/threonine-protein kinase PknK, partial [Ginsengibacter sp.]